ncbi:hypothetical protein H4R19_001336 [Coemansia spiralis]|nr:hypothetical protein H4R19_001336 [Coemansia spiralis]
MARKVTIAIHYVSAPFAGLARVVERMSEVDPVWHRVHSLELLICRNPSTTGSDDTSTAAHEEDIHGAAEALVSLLPGVRQLKIGNYSYTPAAGALYGRIAGLYAGQLQRIDSRHPISVPHEQLFGRLKDIRLVCGGARTDWLPRVDPGSIERLSLNRCPFNHSWAQFSADNSPQVIHFTKLQSLCLVYTKPLASNGAVVRHPDGHPWKLHFPALKRFIMWCAGDACPLLEYAVFPKHLDSIRLEAQASVFHSIAKVALPATRRLELPVGLNTGRGPGDLDAVDHILNAAHGCHEKTLELMDLSIAMLPDTITCTDLTKLVVSAATSPKTAIALVDKFPRLRHLALYHVALDGIWPEALVEDDAACDAVAPLDSVLEKLTIRFARGQFSPDVAVPLAKYLLLSLPRLTHLIATQVHKQPIEDFVRSHPRLSSVVLDLHDDGSK